MKLVLFLAFSFLAVSCLSGQDAEAQDKTLETGALRLENINKSSAEKVKGSPYSNEAYMPAKVNELEKTQFVRLNAVTNSLEVKINPSKIIILDSNNNFNIKFSDGSSRKFTTTAYPDEDLKPIRAILEIVSENENYTLFKRERKIFVEARKGGTYTDKKPAEYVSLPDVYYISYHNNQSTDLVEVPRRKKNFFTLFQSHSKEVSQFVKQENLSISEKNDVVEILDFYFEIKK